MATTFKNALSTAVGTTPVIVYTAASNVKTTILGISLSNMTSSYITVSVQITDPAPSGIITGTISNGSPTITGVSTFSELAVGATLVGTNIPNGTTVLSFNTSLNTVTMSQNATGASTEQISFSSPTPVSAYYVNGVILPPNQSLRVLNGGEKLVLGSSNTISVSANTASAVDVVVSLVEIV